MWDPQKRGCGNPGQEPVATVVKAIPRAACAAASLGLHKPPSPKCSRT